MTINLTKKLNNALSIFTKAQKQLSSVCELCSKQLTELDREGEKIEQAYLADINKVTVTKEQTKVVLLQAEQSLEQVNKILGQ